MGAKWDFGKSSRDQSVFYPKSTIMFWAYRTSVAGGRFFPSCQKQSKTHMQRPSATAARSQATLFRCGSRVPRRWIGSVQLCWLIQRLWKAYPLLRAVLDFLVAGFQRGTCRPKQGPMSLASWMTFQISVTRPSLSLSLSRLLCSVVWTLESIGCCFINFCVGYVFICGERERERDRGPLEDVGGGYLSNLFTFQSLVSLDKEYFFSLIFLVIFILYSSTFT